MLMPSLAVNLCILVSIMVSEGTAPRLVIDRLLISLMNLLESLITNSSFFSSRTDRTDSEIENRLDSDFEIEKSDDEDEGLFCFDSISYGFFMIPSAS